jgi:V8-like Glu-specific endopeptidase
MKTKTTLISTIAEFDPTHTRSGIETENPDQTQRRRNQVPKTTIPLFSTHRRALSAMLAFTVFGCVCEGLAKDQVTHVNGLTVLEVQNPQAAVDFVNAKPMPLPINDSPEDSTQSMIQALLAAPDLGPSGGSLGAQGTGIMSPVFLGAPAAAESGVTPEDFGTNNHPFTTARADLFGLNTNKVYPYRAAGKLFFNIGTAGYICSASLIKRGVVVTAAHCVANYGQSQFYSGWQFVPGYRNGVGPFGTWTAKQVWILTSYYKGTDGCAQYGVICPDDVAVIVLNGTPGNTAGWLGYWYGGGFTSNHLFQITQLGYPAGLDNAAYMERNDSYGYTSGSLSNNTIIGSNMNGGSSGGPWLENFGLPSVLTGETNGSFPPQNVVVGVTSWGYTSISAKEQGAAPFTSGNIGFLVSTVCSKYPGNC